jgi:hypothetical protein
LATLGRFADATVAWGRAARLRQDTQHLRDRQDVYDDCVAVARLELSEEDFARGWQSGMDATTDAVLQRLRSIDQRA